MKIQILGGSTTKFGELWGISLTMLVREAMQEALRESGLLPSQIDAIFVGNMLSGVVDNQANLASLISQELGVFVPAFRLEGACASGGLALHNAILSLRSKQYTTALVVAVEKMTDRLSDDSANALMAAGSEEERIAGATFPGLYSLRLMPTHTLVLPHKT